MSKKTLLIIAAVAVMLVGATSAYGYYEVWNGWFNSGYLTLDGEYTFDYEYGEGILDDRTSGEKDTFYITTLIPGTFTCATTGYYIMLWPHTASGYKPTGQSGQKEASNGAWIGHAKLYDDHNELIDTFTVWGTWNTRAPNDYFDYTMCPCPPATPTYSAHWYFGSSTPAGIITDGEGGSEGERIDYSP